MAPPADAFAEARTLLRDQTILALRRSHRFYLGLTLFLMATVVLGFWPSYFGTLLGGGVTRPLAFAAVARMNLALPIVFVVWMAPMVALAAFDLVSARRVHQVTVICSAVMAIAFLRVLLSESEGWLVIGRALLQPFV